MNGHTPIAIRSAPPASQADGTDHSAIPHSATTKPAANNSAFAFSISSRKTALFIRLIRLQIFIQTVDDAVPRLGLDGLPRDAIERHHERDDAVNFSAVHVRARLDDLEIAGRVLLHGDVVGHPAEDRVRAVMDPFTHPAP